MTSPSSAQRRPRLWWTKPARRTRSLPAQARDCATSRPETAAPGRTHCSFARLAAVRTPSPSHTRAPSIPRRDALVAKAALLELERFAATVATAEQAAAVELHRINVESERLREQIRDEERRNR